MRIDVGLLIELVGLVGVVVDFVAVGVGVVGDFEF